MFLTIANLLRLDLYRSDALPDAQPTIGLHTVTYLYIKNYEDIKAYLQCAAKKDPLKQISLFSV